MKLENQGVIHPDAHMFTQEDFSQSEYDLVIAIMTHLLLNYGLKEWGEKAYSASKRKMK